MHKNAVTTRWLVHYALESRLRGGNTICACRKRRILEVEHENLCTDDGCEKTIEEVAMHLVVV